MSLTDGDKAECKEIAREIIQEVLTIHVDTCPHGRTMMKMFWMAAGIAVGSGVASGGVVLVVVKMIGGL